MHPPADPPAPPTVAADTAEVAEELRAVVARLVRRIRAEYVVPAHQFSVLRTIERDGPQTASGLAAVELVRPQSMAHTLKQLDTAGLLTRTADPADGRQTLVGLSDDGLTALRRQRRDVTGWLAESMEDRLTADEQRRLADAVQLLGRLVDG